MRMLAHATVLSIALVGTAEAATYRCGNTFQETPCSGQQPKGGEVKVFDDKPVEADQFMAEVRRVAAAGSPYVAKYPNLYYWNGVWVGQRLVDGRMVSVADALQDPDVVQLDSQIRSNRYRQRARARDEKYEREMESIRVQSLRRQKAMAVERAQQDARRVCRASSILTACQDARSAVERAEKELRDAGGPPD